MEALQRMIRDGVVEGVREGFSSESTAVVLSSSFNFLNLLPPKLDAERTRQFLVMTDVRNLSFHRSCSSHVRSRASVLLRGLLVQLVSLTLIPGAGYLQGVRQTSGCSVDDLGHASSAGPRRS